MWREIKRLDDIPEKKPEEVTRLDEFKSLFAYYGEATCAADGMCQEKCPVKINTGDMIKQIRAEEMQGGEHKKAEGVAMKLANNMPAFNSYVPKLLNTVNTNQIKYINTITSSLMICRLSTLPFLSCEHVIW